MQSNIEMFALSMILMHNIPEMFDGNHAMLQGGVIHIFVITGASSHQDTEPVDEVLAATCTD